MNKMKIMVPINNIEYVKLYSEAGADEFYLGFHDEEWTECFGCNSEINRMSGFGMHANRYNIHEAIELIREIHKYGKSAFVTINASSYSNEEIKYIDSFLEKLSEVNPDGIIISGLALLPSVEKYHLKPVMSTMAGIYNTDILNFYYNSGIKRVILPRDLTLKEITDIMDNNKNVEYELFLMRNGCFFSDSQCLGAHKADRISTCGTVRSDTYKHICDDVSDFETTRAFDELHHASCKEWHKFACGLCALYRFYKLGVEALKIVGRADRAESVCKDIELAKHNIAIAVECSDEKEYLKKMEFPKPNLSVCAGGLSCYYPEIRF